MKNCETCGIEVIIAMTPFADEVTGYIGENGVTCLKCADAVGEGNYESDDYGYEDDYEDPAVIYERERAEAFQDRVDMWRNEY